MKTALLFTVLFMTLWVTSCREVKSPAPQPAASPVSAPAPALLTLASIAPNTEEDAKPADFSRQVSTYSQAAAAVTSDSIRSMLQNQAQILQNPANPELKRQVMEKQFNGAEVFAAGIGKPNPRMNPAQNRIAAGRAATMDALRWLTYFKYWQETGFKKTFGSLKDVVPPGYQVLETVYLPDGTALVRVKINLQQ